MEGKNLKSILDEGGYVDYRDIFRNIEYNDEFSMSDWEDDFEDLSENDYMEDEELKPKRQGRRKKKSKKH